MLAMSSPSLNRIMVSFSYFVSFAIIALHIVTADFCQPQSQFRFIVAVHFHTECAVEAAIPVVRFFGTQLDCKVVEQLSGNRVGCDSRQQLQTVNRCPVVGATEGVKGFLLVDVQFHSVFLLDF